MKSFSSKTVLITGAAGGLGYEFVKQLLGSGSRVVLTDLSRESMEQVVEKARHRVPRGGEVLAILEADISSREGSAELSRQVMDVAPGLDMVIHNAGLITYGDFADTPPEKWESLMKVNLLAPMRLTELLLPAMLERGSGQMVYVCSVAGFVATSLGTAYSSSKFGLRGFAMSLSGEVKKKGVDVSIVYPFFTKTRLLETEVHGQASLPVLPVYMTGSPGAVVAAALRGVARRKLHIYPGPYPKGLWLANKVWPLVARQFR